MYCVVCCVAGWVSVGLRGAVSRFPAVFLTREFQLLLFVWLERKIKMVKGNGFLSPLSSLVRRRTWSKVEDEVLQSFRREEAQQQQKKKQEDIVDICCLLLVASLENEA